MLTNFSSEEIAAGLIPCSCPPLGSTDCCFVVRCCACELVTGATRMDGPLGMAVLSTSFAAPIAFLTSRRVAVVDPTTAILPKPVAHFFSKLSLSERLPQVLSRLPALPTSLLAAQGNLRAWMLDL